MAGKSIEEENGDRSEGHRSRLARTATLTQKIAHEMLGISPCYHITDVLANLSLARWWSRGSAKSFLMEAE